MRSTWLLPISLLLAPLGARGEAGADAGRAADAVALREGARAWNLSVGTGAGGIFDFSDGFAGANPPYEAHRESRLQLTARLDREVGRRFRVGVAYTWFSATWGYEAAGVPVSGSLHDRAHVLLADATLSWVRRPRFELYSALGVGAGWGRSSGTVAGTPYDERAAGLSVGGERVRLFADLGVGFEGLLVGGLLVRL